MGMKAQALQAAAAMNKRMASLLRMKCYWEHTGCSVPEALLYDEECDDPTAVPGPLGAAEVDGHDQCDLGADAEDCADVVESLEALGDGFAGLWVEGWHEKQVDGEYDAADDQVDVEAPAPVEACEATANNRTKDGACTPD